MATQGRPNVYGKTAPVTFSLSLGYWDKLDAMAKADGVTRTEKLRNIIDIQFTKSQKKKSPTV